MTAIDTTGMTPKQARLAKEAMDAASRLHDANRELTKARRSVLRAACATSDAYHELIAALDGPIPWVEDAADVTTP